MLRPIMLALQPLHQQLGIDKHIGLEKFTVLLFVFGAIVVLQVFMKAIAGYDTFDE